jgi:threonylcarbamoyladenosine tRNA methylthiotransferase MtaB
MDDLSVLDKWFRNIQGFNECTTQCLNEVTLQKYTHKDDKPNLKKRIILFIGYTIEKYSKQLGIPEENIAGISKILDELEQRRRKYVQIGSGCVNNCHYCAIKLAKGEPVSRPVDHILNDIRNSYRDGNVLSLVADDCGSYGVDTGESLFSLIHRISREFPGIPIDCSYLNPVWIEQNPLEYLELFKTANINTINLSLQSGSNRIIHRMNRRYNVENVLKTAEQIKKVSPGTFLWTHFITGYPSETWGDFTQSVRASKYFDFFAAYAYCPRRGTAAAGFPNNNSQFTRIVRKTVLHVVLALRLVKKLVMFTN